MLPAHEAVPPIIPFSIIIVFNPYLAQYNPAVSPAGPAPIIATSYSFILFTLSKKRGVGFIFLFKKTYFFCLRESI
ncbi:MAG: hypothetical protein BWY55_00673 [archaeon ADurb.Bin336]|nr:MAG: hypothetical protein BWY55_00673 [archaeon ADurb.Bin336]